jgi:hypothetical protein
MSGILRACQRLTVDLRSLMDEDIQQITPSYFIITPNRAGPVRDFDLNEGRPCSEFRVLH